MSEQNMQGENRDAAQATAQMSAQMSAQTAAQTAAKTAAPDITFQEGIGELEGIIRALEGGQLELEDSLLKYERGVALLRALQSKIDDAQQKVTVLLGEIEPQSSDDVDGKLS